LDPPDIIRAITGCIRPAQLPGENEFENFRQYGFAKVTWRKGVTEPPKSAIFTVLETAVSTYRSQALCTFKCGFVASVRQKSNESVKKVKNEVPDAVQRHSRPEHIKPLIQLVSRENPELRVQGMSICNEPYVCAAFPPHFLTYPDKT
jgi:hypothetical protein